MDGYLDSDYQPPRAFNRKRVQERTIDEFVGICKGLLADERLSGKDVGCFIIKVFLRWALNASCITR